MGRLRRIEVASTALVLAVTGCNDAPTSPRDLREVRGFVDSEPIVLAQSVEIVYADRETGLVLFSVQNGPPQDCPSGCFFDRALGVRAAGRIGWWDSPHSQGPWTMFDVLATDAALFEPAALTRMKGRLPGLDSWIFYSFAYFLACDPDTPTATRAHLATLVGQPGFPHCYTLS
jgi:hypothetical protein